MEFSLNQGVGMISPQEQQSMTVYGETFSAQIRDNTMAFHFMEDAPRSTEDGHPVIMPPHDVIKLRMLLEEAQRRIPSL